MIAFIKECFKEIKKLNRNLLLLNDAQARNEELNRDLLKNLDELVKANREFILLLQRFVVFKAELEIEEKKEREKKELDRKATKYDGMY